MAYDDDDDFLPASWRTDDDELDASMSLIDIVRSDMDVKRLNIVHSWLWLAGRPVPPRPLHHQLFMGRRIVINERLDLHMLWEKDCIFLKPIPDYMLMTDWRRQLDCSAGCNCSIRRNDDLCEDTYCEEAQTRRTARGFLLSYAALIQHKSDFWTALDKRLIPAGYQWIAWKKLVKQLLDADDVYSNVNKRFTYGELRLTRLDYIYASTGHGILRGYQSRFSTYSEFLKYNFALLAAIIVWMALVLNAMQVGLATQFLNGRYGFQQASVAFVVFALLSPLVMVGSVILTSIALPITDLWATAEAVKRRARNRERARRRHSMSRETTMVEP